MTSDALLWLSGSGNGKTNTNRESLASSSRWGAVCDWKRTRFTLDEGCSKAVRVTFFDLFRQDLIYRGKRLVNWDTELRTAVSDDEVVQRTIKGNFWNLKYPVIDPQPGEPAYITIATTPSGNDAG